MELSEQSIIANYDILLLLFDAYFKKGDNINSISQISPILFSICQTSQPDIQNCYITKMCCDATEREFLIFI